MKVRPFGNVGVEIYDVNIDQLTPVEYSKIVDIFFDELIVIIRDQKVNPLSMAKIAASFGDICNWQQCVWNSEGERITPPKELDPFQWQGDLKNFPVQRVTGKKVKGERSGIFGTGILDWHCNINGVSWAPGVALQAVAGLVKGTSTSWMDTTKAYQDLPDSLKKRCEPVIGHFAYSPEIWAEGISESQLQNMTGGKQWLYKMPLVNTSERGKKGLYFHFLNECTFPSDPELLPILKEHCFQEKYIQTVDWREGDIHLSHQILTLHRREQNDPAILANRILNRYSFNFSKTYPDSKPLYVR